MAHIIGIDLGTTNSCVAVIGTNLQTSTSVSVNAPLGKPQVLASRDNERTTPSVVAWQGNDVLVGTVAKRQQVTNAAGTIFGSKRLIGRKVNAPEIASFARLAPFAIVAAPNGDAWIRVNDKSVSPQEVASHILRRMKNIAEDALGVPVTQAIVTVPAYFDEFQRQATRAAGQIAGLDIIRILNEPTAAAFAYGAHRMTKARRNIAVFDLGGGTFDISIMAIDNGIFEVLSTGGDTSLGGEDWDRAIVDALADEIFQEHRVDVTQSPVAISRLREASENAKKELSAQSSCTLELPFLLQDASGQQINFSRKLTRKEVETWTTALFERLVVPCERALDEARLSSVSIDEVLLVGGMTRWPAITGLVEKIFGSKISKGANPDEVVALGAAAFAAVLTEETDTTLLDVTPHDIGLRIGDDKMSVLVLRNSMLPCRSAKTFATTSDNQKHMAFELFQGNSDKTSQNRKIGRIELDDLPPGKAGSVKVEICLTVDTESIVSVTAKDLSSGRSTDITIRPSGGLSPREIEDIISKRAG